MRTYVVDLKTDSFFVVACNFYVHDTGALIFRDKDGTYTTTFAPGTWHHVEIRQPKKGEYDINQ